MPGTWQIPAYFLRCWAVLLVVLAVSANGRGLRAGTSKDRDGSRGATFSIHPRCLEAWRNREDIDRSKGLEALEALVRMKQRLKQAAGNQIQPPSTFLENVPIVIGGQHKVTVCMVQKVGSSRFKLLFLRRMGYTPDTLLGPGHAINPHEGYLIGSPTTMPSYISELLDAQRQRILIVRSPYARVLSAFLNKVVCSGCPAGGASERFAELLVERLHESVGMPLDLRHRGIGAEALFSLFIDTLYASFASREAHDRERLLASLDPHLSPISTMCLIPEGFGYDYVFKLEAMDEWYGGFLALTGLEDSAASGWHISSWLNVVGDPTEVCFYRPMGVHCADVQRLTNDCTAGNPSLAPFNTSSVASLNRQRLQQSANMSETKLHNFYTRELAAKVTQMYQQDLLRFGYPAWDGQSLYNPIQQF